MNKFSIYSYLIVVFVTIPIFCSCNYIKKENPESKEDAILEIDSRTFSYKQFVLTDIAEDIIYIPLDNNILLRPIESFKIIDDFIYFSGGETALVRFNINGKDPQQIGNIGKGPGEYFFSNSFAVDKQSGNIFIKGKRDRIIVYCSKGKYVKEILLPTCQYGLFFSDIEFLNSALFLAQYINQGRAQYNWVIIDTLGNILSQKPNSITQFETRRGNMGGIYKFRNSISYWNAYNDTLFVISPDFSYQMSMIFTPGEHRMPMEDFNIQNIQQFLEEYLKYFRLIGIIETNSYWIFRYMYDSLVGIAIIDKKVKKYFQANMNGTSKGF